MPDLNTTVYQIKYGSNIISHSKGIVKISRDGSGNPKLDELDAIIRSGMYFVTIATKLDLLAHHIKKDSKVEEHQLQDLISELLFIQSHYKIKKKKRKG